MVHKDLRHSALLTQKVTKGTLLLHGLFLHYSFIAKYVIISVDPISYICKDNTELRGVTSQKTAVFTVTTMRTSDFINEIPVSYRCFLSCYGMTI